MATVITNPRKVPTSAIIHPPKRVWTTGKKVMGNLIPALIALPVAAWGIAYMAAKSEIVGRGLVIFALAPIVAWMAMNFFGLYQNRQLKREIEGRLLSLRPQCRDPRNFVGIATPKYRSLVDPHEDVGLMILHADSMEFFGDRLNLTIPRQDIRSIGFRANPHTLVGLGRWVSIEGKIGAQAIRLQAELRDSGTLFGNFLRSGDFKRRLERWVREPG